VTAGGSRMQAEDISPAPPQGGGSRRGSVGVSHDAGVAIVSMGGEHDIATAPAVSDALERAVAHSSVLVDLSECAFIDSTVIGLLIRCAHEVEHRDERFALVIPPDQPVVARAADLTRLAEFLAVHGSREAGLAHLQRAAEPQ
jgi:anti-anti-sigma factor